MKQTVTLFQLLGLISAIVLVSIVVWGVFHNDLWKIALQYIFWLRVPIVFGLILFIFPILANTIAANLIQNLFVMRGRWQLMAVMISSTLAALMVSFVSESIIENAPARFSEIVSFASIPAVQISAVQRYLLALALLSPTWIVTIRLSLQTKSLVKEKLWLGFLLGISASCGFIFFVYFGSTVIKCLLNTYPIVEKAIEKIINYLTLGYSQGYLDTNGIREEHFLGFALAILGFVIYSGVGYLYKPGRKHPSIIQNIIKNREAPALMYPLLLVWMITGIFGGVTFYLDLFGIPVFWLLIGVCVLGYVVCGVNHYFKLEELQDLSQKPAKKSILITAIQKLRNLISKLLKQNCKSNKKSRIPLEKLQTQEQKRKQLKEFATAIDNRLKEQPKENGRTLVVVAASGGGIQASGWTAKVLAGLQEELGCSFTKAIGLISSVSGGSVGTMYFLDRFTQQGFPSNLNSIFKNATEDWLDAVGWGIAYPDLIRLTGWLSPLIGKYNDRGFALEHDWQINMTNRETPTTLEDWRKKIIKGEIPIPVFNTTLVEDGRRFLISPMKFIESALADLVNSDEDRKVLDFQTLYGGYDLNVTTAARLSATFPYVSPLPRNDQDIAIDLPEGKKFYGNYHFADGGYFDNSGLFTAVEWIDRGLNSFLKDLDIKRILLLQINAFPESESKLKEGSKEDKKWFMQSLGPLQTIFAVRNSTLISRNFKEAELLAKKWQDKVEIKHFMISFSEGYKQPLSWRLTEEQKDNLKNAWQDVTNSLNFQKLKNLWKEDWQMPYYNNKKGND